NDPGTPPDGLVYFPEFLIDADQQTLVGQVRDLPFIHDRFRGQPLKRAYAQFGYSYGSSGRRVTPAPPLPAFLAALAESALPHCPAGTRFNQCIVTHYPEGAGIGWHPDAPA